MAPVLALIPPYRFAMVEEGLYRGAYPSAKNFRFLLRLQLRTIVSLIPHAPTPELTEFCAANGINLVHMRVDVFKEKIPISPAGVAQVLQLLIDTTHHPLLVHCMNGAEVTGIVIMCLRKLQNYSPSFAMVELQRHLREGVFAQEMLEFHERFNSEVTVPARIPRWLWEGQHLTRKHPTVKIKLVRGEPDVAARTSAEEAAQQREEFRRRMLCGLPAAQEPPSRRHSPVLTEKEMSLTLRALSLETRKDGKD